MSIFSALGMVNIAMLLHFVHAGIQDLSGLVRYYTGDNTLIDANGSGNNLVAYQQNTQTTAKFITVDDTVPFSATSRYAFQLDPSASDAYHLRANVNGFPMGNAARTMMSWLKITAVGGGWCHFLAYGGVGTLKTYSIMTTSEGTISTDFHGNVEPASLIPFDPDFTTTMGQWRHIAMTMQGRQVKSYINGVLASQGALTGDPITTADIPFHIGGNLHSYPNGNGNRFHGQIAEVAIYNRELTAQELLDYVNNASSGGDPHFVGFGNIAFSWQGSCETVLVKTPQVSTTVNNINIHIRTRFVRKWSAIDGVAIKFGELVGEIDSNEGNLILNGSKADSYQSEALIITKTALKKKMILYKFVIDKDKTLEVKVNKRTRMVFTTVKGNFPKDTIGLLGSPDNPGFYGRDGREMDKQNINAYAEEWQVNDHDPKLFKERRPPQYPEACKYKTAQVESNDHTRQLKEMSSIKRSDAIAACITHRPGPLKNFCIEDVLSTGDLDIAQETFYG